MNPFLPEIRRLLRTPATWLLLILLVAACVLFVVVSPQSTPSPSQSVNLAVTVTYSSSYVFSVYTFDGAGVPVGGAQVHITLETPNSTLPPVGSVSGFTSSAGFSSLSLMVPPAVYYAVYSVDSNGRSAVIGVELPVPQIGKIEPGPGTFTLVQVGDFSLTPNLVVAFPTPSGFALSGLSVSYYINESGQGVSGPSSNLTGDVGPLATMAMRFQFSLPPGASSGFPIVFQLRNGSGAILASQSFDLGSVVAGYSGAAPSGEILSTWIQWVEFLVLAFGVLMGYVAYGRDRISGALEPVLAQPVSRVQVLYARYVAAAVMIAGGVSASVVFLAAWIGLSAGISTPASLVVAVWGSVLWEGLVILALVMLLSQLSMSHITVLGGGLTLAAVLSLFWKDVTSVVGDFAKVPSVTQTTSTWQGTVGLLSPARIVANPAGWVLNTQTPNGGDLLSISPNPVLAWVALVVWLSLPLVALALCARYRD